jgi:hypothetical protein
LQVPFITKISTDIAVMTTVTDHYLGIVLSINPTYRQRAENILLELAVRFEPQYVQPLESQPGTYTSKILEHFKSLIKINDSNLLVPTAPDVQPFLEWYFGHRDPAWRARGHSLVAKQCLDTLGYAIECWPTLDKCTQSSKPVVQYAVKYWHKHLAASDNYGWDLIDVFLRVFREQEAFEKWRAAYWARPWTLPGRWEPCEPMPASLLEVLLSAGAESSAKFILEREDHDSLEPWWALPNRDNDGSKLWWALPNRDVELLDETKERLYYAVAQTDSANLFEALKSRIGPPPREPKHFLALSRAALGGNRTIMRLLLWSGVDADCPMGQRRGATDPYTVWPNTTYLGERSFRSTRPTRRPLDKNENIQKLYNWRDEEAWKRSVKTNVKGLRTPWTPLRAAFYVNDLDALEILRNAGVHANWEKEMKRILSADSQRVEVLKWLIQVHCDEVWAHDNKLKVKKLYQLLKLSCSRVPNQNITSMILDMGANPNEEPVDEAGKMVSSPLNDAFIYMKHGIHMVSEGVDDNGKSVRQIVEEKGQVVRALLEAGAKADIYTKAFVRDKKCLKLIMEVFEKTGQWEDVLNAIDNEYLDDTWIVLTKEKLSSMKLDDQMESIEDHYKKTDEGEDGSEVIVLYDDETMEAENF